MIFKNKLLLNTLLWTNISYVICDLYYYYECIITNPQQQHIHPKSAAFSDTRMYVCHGKNMKEAYHADIHIWKMPG